MIYKMFFEEELFNQEFHKMFQKNKCIINNCKKKTICLEIFLDFLETALSNSIKEVNIPIKEFLSETELEKFLEIKDILLSKKLKKLKIYSLFCIEHEYTYYKDFVFESSLKIKLLKDIDLKNLKVKNFIEKAQEKFRLTRFLELFLRKIYTLLCAYGTEKDTLLKSLKSNGLLIKEGFTLDSEKVWFSDINYYYSFPIYLRRNTILSEYIGKNTIGQGHFNGPDYILKNIKNGKTIGLEIIEYQRLIFNVEKINNLENFIQKMDPKISKYMDGDWEKQIDILNKIIENKLVKSEKYKTTDELLLGIILNHKIEGYRYYLLEFWTNINYSKWKYNPNTNLGILFNEIMFF